MGTKAQITQKLLNEYPEWSDVRTDEQSLGAQFINTIGTQLEDLHEQLKTLGLNYYPTTANKKDIDVVYQMQLPLTKTFEVVNTDPNNPIYNPPTVSGLATTGWRNIVTASGNNIESFWYNEVPTRLECVSYPINNIILDDASNNIYSGITSMLEVDSPLVTASGINIDYPKGQLWLEMYNGEQYLNITDQGQATRGMVTIKGTTRKGQADSESIIFIHNEIQRTTKEWSNIETISINDIVTDQAKLRVLQHRFGRTQIPQLPPEVDFTNLTVSAFSKEDIDLFWDISVNDFGKPILQLLTWQVDDIKSRVGGLLGTQVIRPFELLNTNSSNISTPIDIAVEPFSNRLWIADANNLYVYTTEQTLPNMRVLSKKNFDSMSVIEPSTYHLSFGDSVQLSYIVRRPISDVNKHRVYVKDPNGITYSILNGAMVLTDPNNAWVFGSPDSRNLRASDIFSLNVRGDWIWNLDVLYSNGASETDQRIISVDSKIALASFALSDYVSNSTIEGIDFDSDQNLWILVNTAGVRIKLKVIPHYDVMLIDYDKKILIFREQYSQIRVL